MTDPVTPPAAGGPDLRANLGNIPLAEKVLAGIALLIIIGWIVTWSSGYWMVYPLFRSAFAALSFIGALVVAVLVILKLFGVRPLGPEIERQVIPIASLLPVLGYLIELLHQLHMFLVVGGSIALAYVSATTYWKKRIPEFARNPLGDSAMDTPPPPPPASAGSVPPAAPPGQPLP